MLKSKIVAPLITNGIVCAMIGAAFGSYGNMLAWIVGGFIVGILLASGWEVIFSRLTHRARLYYLRPILLVLVDFLLVVFRSSPCMVVGRHVHPHRVKVAINTARNRYGL
jgi:hypothetical protein